MAAYIEDILQMGNWRSNMATLNVRNQLYRFWPRKMATDAITGETAVVMDKLFLLVHDVYVNEANMDMVGRKYVEVDAYTEMVDPKVGDIVEYKAYNEHVVSYNYSESYEDNSYPILKVGATLPEVKYYIRRGKGGMSTYTLYNVTLVTLKVPTDTPYSFPGTTEFLNSQLLSTHDQIVQRKVIHNILGLYDIVDAAVAEDDWKQLDTAWLEFSDIKGVGMSNNITTYQYAYRSNGVQIGDQFTVTRTLTVSIPDSKYADPILLMDRGKVLLDAAIADNNYGDIKLGAYTTITGCDGQCVENCLNECYSRCSEKYPQDYQNNQRQTCRDQCVDNLSTCDDACDDSCKWFTADQEFSIYVLNKAGALDTGETRYAKQIGSYVEGPTSIRGGYYSSGMDEDYDSGWGTTPDPTATRTITSTIQVVKLMEPNHPVWVDITDVITSVEDWVADREAEAQSDEGGGYDTPVLNQEQSYIRQYGSDLALNSHDYSGVDEDWIVNPDNWVTTKYQDNQCWDGTACYGNINERTLKHEKLRRFSVDQMAYVFNYMEFNYAKDKKKRNKFLSFLSAIVSMVLIVVAVVATVASFGAATPGAAALLLLAAGASGLVLVGMQYALANAGYHDAAQTVGSFLKIYTIATMVSGIGAAISQGIMTAVRHIAVQQALKQVTSYVAKKIGGTAAIIINALIAVGTGSAMSGFATTMTHIANGIMAAFNSAMATDTYMSGLALDEARNYFTEDENELLDEIAKDEAESLAQTSRPGSIMVDQEQWSKMVQFNPVDRIEDQYQTFERRINNMYTKNYT